MGAFDEYYRILELEPGSSYREVQRAYRRLAKLWHPDHVSRHPQLRKKCEEKMRGLNEAYQRLKELRPPAKPAREPEEPAAATESEDPSPRKSASPQPQREESPPAPQSWRRLQASSLGAWNPQAPPRVRLRRPLPRPLFSHPSVAKVATAFSAAIAAMLLFFIVDQPIDHPYYGTLRFIVCFACLYGAFQSLLWRHDDLLILLIAIAILFNPVLPVSISFGEWIVFNSIVPVILICAVFEMHRRALPEQ